MKLSRHRLETVQLGSLAFALALAAAACGPTNINPSVDLRKRRKTIPPSGGVVTLDNGANLTFPPGAVAADVKVEVTTTLDTPALPADGTMEKASLGYTLRPHGTQFEAPIAVVIPCRDGLSRRGRAHTGLASG